jgi:hypothetical protein
VHYGSWICYQALSYCSRFIHRSDKYTSSAQHNWNSGQLLPSRTHKLTAPASMVLLLSSFLPHGFSDITAWDTSRLGAALTQVQTWKCRNSASWGHPGPRGEGHQCIHAHFFCPSTTSFPHPYPVVLGTELRAFTWATPQHPTPVFCSSCFLERVSHFFAHGDPPTFASLIAGITGMCHKAYLDF